MKKDDTPKDTASKSCPDQSKYKREPTKLESVLAYLTNKGSITPSEALQYCNCWRLSAVVHTLKKAGIPIETHQEKHNGGYHARYYLAHQTKAEKHLEALQERSRGGKNAAA